MLYEKKMIILSGEGKGVVLIERSAHGVRFSLSTFDMPVCGALKAGVITDRSVFVRDLPARDSPSLVFVLDIDSADGLHFAVFDKRLRLYGTNAKTKMWEANVMDLLTREKVADRSVVLPAMPPVSAPPKALPDADGTGIPQTRLDLYGDEAIALTDFYSSVDLAAHMPRVDSFLDAPRALSELAPRIVPRSRQVDAPQQPEDTGSRDQPINAQTDVEIITDNAQTQTDGEAINDRGETQSQTSGEIMIDSGEQSSETQTDGEISHENAEHSEITQQPEEEAAATSDEPWLMEARWLKKRGNRGVHAPIMQVRREPVPKKVRKVREPRFGDVAKSDINKLFQNAPRDVKLSKLLPEIEWVRVESDGMVISVGRTAEFLCYAVAGNYEPTSPLGEKAQWLPADREKPRGAGYWLVFQSAATGDIV